MDETTITARGTLSKPAIIPVDILNHKTKLDDLDGKTDELLMGAMDFEKFGRDLKRKYQWERAKLVLVFGAGAIVNCENLAYKSGHLLPFHSIITLAILINITSISSLINQILIIARFLIPGRRIASPQSSLQDN